MGHYSHDDAYRLFIYADDTGDAEAVWNARDGASPGTIVGTRGMLMRKISDGAQALRYVPPVGSLVIVDLDFDKALSCQERYVSEQWDDLTRHPVIGRLSQEMAARFIATGRWHAGRHFIVKVDDEMRQSFAALALDFITRPADGLHVPCQISCETRCDDCYLADHVAARSGLKDSESALGMTFGIMAGWTLTCRMMAPIVEAMPYVAA